MQTKTKSIGAAAASFVLLGLAAGCGGSAGTQKTTSTTLVGAGSTLVAPLVAQWQKHSGAFGASVTYGPVGSGGGIEQITARTVDFGASDGPLTPDQAKSCQGCVMIPWALAATTISYNVPGLSRPLRLSGPVIADMYLGRIKAWNDPQIARLNPGVELPSTAVRPVYRSDASGDTYAFTDFLSRLSPAWRSKVGGASTGVSWPTGVGAAKNSGVAAAVQSTPGAIGYVAIGEATADKLHYAQIENRGRAFVKPATTSIAAAAQTAGFRSDNSASIVDPPGSAKTAYPISTFTYAIVPRSSHKLAELKKFLTYAVTAGQKDATALEFAPLPQNVVAKDRAIIKGL